MLNVYHSRKLNHKIVNFDLSRTFPDVGKLVEVSRYAAKSNVSPYFEIAGLSAAEEYTDREKLEKMCLDSHSRCLE
jgi:hypothetical protein